mmetsp:Transcript_83485/g.241586  ORF Transcript_83485/g.241586 Transcript_83485/m.241586 type:complete len:138 (+) Transcript_83485:24-437(+)
MVWSEHRVPPRRSTFGSQVQTLYHLTPAGAAIRSTGRMLPGSRGKVGGGIYFCHSLTDCSKKSTQGKGWKVTARVLVGRAKELHISQISTHDFTRLQREGFDSIRLIGLTCGVEYVVFNADQVELVSVEQMRSCVVQ